MFGAFGLGGAGDTSQLPPGPPSTHFYPSSFLEPAKNVPAVATPSPASARLSQGDFKAAVQSLIFGARVVQQNDFAQFAGVYGMAHLEKLETKIDNLVSSQLHSHSTTTGLDQVLDTNHDGVVNDNELLTAGDAAFTAPAADPTPSAPAGLANNALDDLLDTNHDGVVSDNELMTAGDAAFSPHAGEVIYGAASPASTSPSSPTSAFASPIYAVVNKLQPPPTTTVTVDADTTSGKSNIGGRVSDHVINLWRKASASDVASIAAAIVEDARKMREHQAKEGSLSAQLQADRDLLTKSLSLTESNAGSEAETIKDAARVLAQVEKEHKQYKRRSVEDFDKQTRALEEDQRRLREMLNADVIKAAQSQLGGGASNSSSLGVNNLILGTMNIIGDAENPIEFEPNAADLQLVEGGAPGFAKAKAECTSAFEACTVQQCLAAVSKSAVLVGKLSSFVSAAGFDGTESVAALCTSKQLDLSYDNKWVGQGRFNPIVFGMSAMGSAWPEDPEVLQMKHASLQPKYIEAIISFYEAKWPSDAAAELNASVAGLLLWDLMCSAAVALAPLAFATLTEASFLVKSGTTEPVAKNMLLRTLFYPLAKSVRNNPVASFIIGCQEMPHEEGALESALPIGMTVYRAPTKSGLVSGFVYSDVLAASFADVSDQLRPEMIGWLREQGIDEKIISTTCTRLLFCQFTVPNVGMVVVANFHCKSFKNKAENQGVFVAHALARASALFNCPAYGVGDMNLEAKWPKGSSAAIQAAAVQAAPLGKLPPITIGNTVAFGESLKAGGFSAFPEAGTLTTLKMRTKFQGQPEKEGDLTAVHKDFIIVPASSKIRNVVIAGRSEQFGNNLQILQPNRQWPSDHFGIFVSLFS